ncbi:DUF4382 domain-containing protein [Reichenbachiella ulvae]|uniref:DUF4382 domain-containing protein n=1 Tax=Reichenbachiella ulvae TaxID=2980104 RepID=A0ABT3CPT7_9BACT|nr:DUF4382 domain-containing protein [Reichenbachiella ulvae]MCV9385701.1 DUF4382 domain-containing protein [Reichenbachiella ulvae]
MNIRKTLKPVALFALAVGILASCDSEKQSARIQISLVDAPGDYDAVMIDIEDILVNTSSDESDESGWQSLDTAEPGIYDLLKLTNGEEAFLGEVELPEGQLGQVRLLLGDENTLVIDGEETALTVPSGSQSGLKLNVSAEITGGVTYKLILDFDVDKSVVKAGNSGKYNLKPVIRAEMEAQTGAISGTVAPLEIGSTVYAIIGEDTIASTVPDETGEFLLRALDAETYSVSAAPEEGSGYDGATVDGVAVVIGEVTDAGELTMTETVVEEETPTEEAGE